MPSESFFMTFGSLGLSLAGFAGLISALDRSPSSRSAIAAYRIRTIVILGFSLMFIGLGTVAAYSATGADLPLAIRVGSALMVVMYGRGVVVDTRASAAWPEEGARRSQRAILVVLVLASLGNLVVASVSYLQVLMLLGLVGPVSIFYNTIRAATAPEPATAPAPTPAPTPAPDASISVSDPG